MERGTFRNGNKIKRPAGYTKCSWLAAFMWENRDGQTWKVIGVRNQRVFKDKPMTAMIPGGQHGRIQKSNRRVLRAMTFKRKTCIRKSKQHGKLQGAW